MTSYGSRKPFREAHDVPGVTRQQRPFREAHDVPGVTRQQKPKESP